MSIEKPTLAKLEKEAEVLHYRIISTPLNLDKKPLQQKRQKLLAQISGLRLKMNDEKEAQAIKDIDELFLKNKKFLAITVNNIRLTFNEALEIPLNHQPCNHTTNIYIKELLRHQRNVKLESVLLTKWSGILRTNTILEAKFNCEKCRANVQRRFEKTRRRLENPKIGTVIVTLRKL